LRRARVNEVGFEIVKTDLESRYRLRRMLIEAAEQSRNAGEDEWTEQRKT
jgi:16S rRNA U1498 N3-methylase RsmE